MRLIQQFLHCLSCQSVIGQINEHQVIVRTAGHDLDISCKQSFAQCLCIVNDSLLIFLEIIGERFLEANCLGSDHMHQRTALNTREDRFVEVIFLSGLLV